MPQRFQDHRLHTQGFVAGTPGSAVVAPALNSQASSAAAEASVQQLIANGKHKAALERAKEIHKAQGTDASEALLVDAYTARIESLMRQNLAVEAKALIELVRDRYPFARTRLDELTARAAARAGALDEMVQTLNDPSLTAERRAATEHAIQKEVCDLAALSECAALSPEDPLRQAASALHQAFIAVTSGPVAEDALALPEVSHRSPLAPWKMLVRAIACFYRREDESCRSYLEAIRSDSAPARLVPAIQAMLGGKSSAPLNAASAALVSRTTRNPAALQSALETLDQSFASDNDSRILKAIRTVVQECRQNSPNFLERLKQHISVRGALADLDTDNVMAAMDGGSRHDAYFSRLFARGMELKGDAENLAMASAMWEEFRKLAVQEGWFAANGAEVAMLYLHMAEVLRKIPGETLRSLQQSARRSKVAPDGYYFLFPETLYQRACALDPHYDAFSPWMDWAKETGAQAENVAEAWHKIRPQDIEPILYLMEATEKRSAFPTALQYLVKAERIDGVHPTVRRARLRLLWKSAMRHVEQKKPALAEEKLAEMAALPQSQQGDRPAFLAALRHIVGAVRGDNKEAAVNRAEVERLLESGVAAALLVFGVAAICKRNALAKSAPVEKLTAAERAALPAALARVIALAKDVQMKLDVPVAWFAEIAKQFPQSRQSLDTDQLRALAEAALNVNYREFSYAASAAGLARGGPLEARFLLLRAGSLNERQAQRSAICAATAAELARQQRDMAVVEEAIELLRGISKSGDLSLTLEQAAEVLRKEKKEPAFPQGNSRGPDYRGILKDKLCQCPECRRARGEIVEPFDDFDIERRRSARRTPGGHATRDCQDVAGGDQAGRPPRRVSR